MSALAKIHVAKKQLGLDDDTYRALLVRVTGKASSREMSEGERQAVVAEFGRLGFTAASKGGRTAGKAPAAGLSGPYAKKLQALWIAGWNLGIVENRKDSALLAWVERQTGLQRVEWLRSSADAKKAVDALKLWLAREGGVDWSTSKLMLPHQTRHGYRIAVAQWMRLHPKGSVVAMWGEVSTLLKRAIVREKPSDAEWITVMNAFGARIRAAREKREAA